MAKKEKREVALPLPSQPEPEARRQSERCLPTPPLPPLLLWNRPTAPQAAPTRRGRSSVTPAGAVTSFCRCSLTAARSFLRRKFSRGTRSLLQRSRQSRPTTVDFFFPPTHSPSPRAGAESLRSSSKPTDISRLFFLLLAKL